MRLLNQSVRKGKAMKHIARKHRTNRTKRRAGIAAVLLAFCLPSLAAGQETVQPQVQTYERSFFVPQQLYQEYRQTVTVEPIRQVMVPRYGVHVVPRPRPIRRQPRGVWGWGPFPLGYIY